MQNEWGRWKLFKKLEKMRVLIGYIVEGSAVEMKAWA
jgi:hypothetical protein